MDIPLVVSYLYMGYYFFKFAEELQTGTLRERPKYVLCSDENSPNEKDIHVLHGALSGS